MIFIVWVFSLLIVIIILLLHWLVFLAIKVVSTYICLYFVFDNGEIKIMFCLFCIYFISIFVIWNKIGYIQLPFDKNEIKKDPNHPKIQQMIFSYYPPFPYSIQIPKWTNTNYNNNHYNNIKYHDRKYSSPWPRPPPTPRKLPPGWRRWAWRLQFCQNPRKGQF